MGSTRPRPLQATPGATLSGNRVSPSTSGKGAILSVLSLINKFMIKQWREAIKKHEGFFPGSRSYRNNNPGNLRFTSYTSSLGKNRGQDSGRFIIYDTLEIGTKALDQFLVDASTNVLRAYKGEMTLHEFYKVYAPSGDGNYPLGYATAVAKDLGVPITTKIKDLLDSVPAPVPAPEPTQFRRVKPGQVISRKQGDPRWGKVFIGQSKTTVAEEGCTITDISNILWWYGYDITPGELAKLLRFTPAGKVYWESVTEKLPIKFVFRYWNFNSTTQAVVKSVLNHPTQTVILEVDYKPGTSFKHWIWALSRNIFGAFRMADPLPGDFATTSRYGGRITGATVFDLKK
jgi:hypothetical protein